MYATARYYFVIKPGLVDDPALLAPDVVRIGRIEVPDAELRVTLAHVVDPDVRLYLIFPGLIAYSGSVIIQCRPCGAKRSPISLARYD